MCKLGPAPHTHSNAFPPDRRPTDPSPPRGGQGSPAASPRASSSQKKGSRGPWCGGSSCPRACSRPEAAIKALLGTRAAGAGRPPAAQAPEQRSAAERWEEGARLGCRFCSVPLGIISVLLSARSLAALEHTGSPTTGSSKNLRGFSQRRGEALRASREGRTQFQAAALPQAGNLGVLGVQVMAGAGTGSCCARAAPRRGIRSTGAFLCRCHRGQEGKRTTASVAHRSASWSAQVCQAGD